MSNNFITLFVNSASGTNRSADGSTFTHRLEPPLRIPRDAKPYVSLLESTTWYNAPNILTGTNDVFKVSFSGVSSGTTQAFTFPAGLYSLASLNLRLGFFLVDLGLASDTLTFVGLQAESKLVLSLKPDSLSGDITVDWTDSTLSMRTFLGFQNNASFTALTSGGETSVTASSVAKFNSLEYYVIEAIGLGISGSYTESGKANSQSLAAIVPDISPSQQILYRPVHPLKLKCDIAGSTIGSIIFRLTDQNHVPQETFGETFSARIQITY